MPEPEVERQVDMGMIESEWTEVDIEQWGLYAPSMDDVIGVIGMTNMIGMSHMNSMINIASMRDDPNTIKQPCKQVCMWVGIGVLIKK